MFTTKAEESLLANLISHTEDSARAFREASDDLPDAAHRRIAASRAEERELIVRMLSSRLREIGTEPPRNGTVRGAFAWSWASFKSAAIGAQGALMDALAAGERALRDEYRDALEHEMHPVTRRLVTEANALMANETPLPDRMALAA